MQNNTDFDANSVGATGHFLRELCFNSAAGKPKSTVGGVGAGAGKPSLPEKFIQMNRVIESFNHGPTLPVSLETAPSGIPTYRAWGINE
jgi:hypothetical protein